jgi:hypothetical protein
MKTSFFFLGTSVKMVELTSLRSLPVWKNSRTASHTSSPTIGQALWKKKKPAENPSGPRALFLFIEKITFWTSILVTIACIPATQEGKNFLQNKHYTLLAST